MPDRKRFISVVSSVWRNKSKDLELLARSAKSKRENPEWFWRVMVTSFCTLGGSKNYSVKHEKYGDALKWGSVESLSDADRAALFKDLPNPRRRYMAEPALESAFQRIKKVGGPKMMAADYEKLKSGKERVKFLKSFDGIGEKYSRNIPMDIYDEYVLDSAALDSRLNNLLDMIEDAPPKAQYKRREEYLRDVCAEAGLPNMWYLDRLLYNCHDEVKTQLA